MVPPKAYQQTLERVSPSLYKTFSLSCCPFFSFYYSKPIISKEDKIVIGRSNLSVLLHNDLNVPLFYQYLLWYFGSSRAATKLVLLTFCWRIRLDFYGQSESPKKTENEIRYQRKSPKARESDGKGAMLLHCW